MIESAYYIAKNVSIGYSHSKLNCGYLLCVSYKKDLQKRNNELHIVRVFSAVTIYAYAVIVDDTLVGACVLKGG